MTFRQALHKNILLLVILITSAFTSFSKDFFWIHNSGNWHDGAHWSLSSGGSPANDVPGPNDRAYIDENSFSVYYPTIQLSQTTEISQLSINSKYYPQLIGEGVSLTVTSGFSATCLYSIKLGQFGKLAFKNAESVPGQINSFGVRIESNITLEGSWSLAHHLLTSDENKIDFVSGTITTNGHTVYGGEINAVNQKVNGNFTGSHIYGLNYLNLEKVSNVGGPAHFRISNGDFNNNDKPAFAGSSWEKTTVICPNPPFQLDLNVTSNYNGQNISCNDSCDGQLTIVASGTPGPFSYSFNSGFGPWTSQTVYSDLCAQEIIPSL
jgi:hypothetical protein